MMLRFRASLLCIFLLVFSTVFSQQKWPNTLLWRISGNGLSKPSYLYGTMHLQDKRLFQFSDSLYRAIEGAEGFALEIDFSEAMDSIFSRGVHNMEDEILEKQSVKLDKKKLDKSADSILKTFGIKGDNITKKDLKKIRDYRMNKLIQRGEMQTIVDGYLFGLALRQGKWTGGIEDVVDQLDLVDEMGGGLTQDEVFQPETKLRNSLDEMMKIYINRDLQSLADYVDSRYDKRSKDELLIHRNIKMARRMDSLSALRTMFFAVGAAHLPGDSGLISLLRDKGFNVDPVFSPQSLSPEAYSSKLNNIPWKAVDDDFYSIKMPGAPSEHNMFGEVLKMKIFFDLPTMTFYMAGHTIGGSNTFSDADKAFEEMAKRMGTTQTKIKAKDVMLGGIRGKESTFDIEEGAYRVALLQKGATIYLLMAGSSQKSNLTNPDVNQFFSSFVAKDPVINKNAWAKFNMSGKGIRLTFPGTPKPNASIDGVENIGWVFKTYDYVDNNTGLYYLLQARDITAGHYLQGDSAYFAAYKEDISKNFQRVLDEEQFIFKGWPAYRLELLMNENIKFKIYNIIRGNRVYLLVAGGDKNSDFSDVARAFNSIEFEDYVGNTTKKYYGEGFTTTAPSRLVKAPKDTRSEDQGNENIHFTSFDSSRVISYEVFKTTFSPFYWFDNDSLFLEKEVTLNKSYNDSVIAKKFCFNGKLKAIEAISERSTSNVLKKMRFFVNADTLYEILTYLPKQLIDDENANKFFDDFKVDNEVQPTIFSRKPKKLLNALESTDTTEFEKALTAFDQVSFTKQDLPLLHQAILKTYIKREEDYRSVNEKIVDELENLADTSTVAFISANYQNIDKEKEEIKYELLHALANIKTKESYSALKKLLLNGPPSKGSSSNLDYSFRDSLELTKSLYPEILSLSNDSAFAHLLVNVSNELLDSGLIWNDILPYKQVFLKYAKRNLDAIKEEEGNWWSHVNLIPFIAKFNDAQSNNLLRDFLTLKEIDAKYTAIISLIKNNQLVSSTDLEKLAADAAYRIDFYNELKKLNRLKFFPAKYATQLKIAESEIFSIGQDDDYVPSSVSFIGERTAVFMGKKQKFYLFKLSYSGDDNTTSYLGITGPYNPSDGEIITSSDASGVIWDEEYNKSKLNEQFKKHLAETEKYLKKKDQPSGK